MDDVTKAEVFNNYFSSVFTKEKDYLMPEIRVKPGIEPLHCLQFTFNDSEIQVIMFMLFAHTH